jgi:hypothetical protein
MDCHSGRICKCFLGLFFQWFDYFEAGACSFSRGVPVLVTVYTFVFPGVGFVTLRHSVFSSTCATCVRSVSFCCHVSGIVPLAFEAPLGFLFHSSCPGALSGYYCATPNADVSCFHGCHSGYDMCCALSFHVPVSLPVPVDCYDKETAEHTINLIPTPLL